MGKRKLGLGIILGAIIGGLAALCDRETRLYTKRKLGSARYSTNYYMKHPSEAIRNVRNVYNEFNEQFNSTADNTINALEQVEQTIGKLTKKDKEPIKLAVTK